jgi:hypothetical protein
MAGYDGEDLEDYEPPQNDEQDDEGIPLSQKDPKIKEAKEVLLKEYFDGEGVYYGQQLEVFLEEKFFHWITARAVNQLAKEGRIRSVPTKLGHLTINFYSALSNRYWTRRANSMGKLVAAYSTPNFVRGLGLQGELMFDAALPLGGFLPKAKNVNEYGGKKWTKTKQNLDRIYERDGIAYGAEIKNTLPYIPLSELLAKIEMCEFLGLRPLFIFRFAPKNYIQTVWKSGGFTLIYKNQLYPLGHLDFARTVKAELQLPVDSPAAISAGTIQRFLKWHLQQNPPKPMP